MGNSKLTAILCVLFYCMPNINLSAAVTSKQVNKSDVRLLIDISGSMKKNDPNNLRIPALQLVTNLLPKGADAGVWAFGRYVNMLVPLSQVDSQWQIKATNAATKINSLGLYTNIGKVLENASYGWRKPDPSEKRSLILLTDGMVDISKDSKVNKNERARILNSVLPKLKKAGVAIHTIALSQNADHELLKELSTQTDGWYQAVNNAEELQKIFLKIFEQAAARDNLPITNNFFSVDKSIDEMTVLVFKKDNNSPSSLISPSNKKYNKHIDNQDLRWFSTNGYDLVTIQNPETGKWKIDADVDPDNRVMVVSKLGLSVAELPNNLLAGEAINYELQMLEDGKVIDNPDFLNLVDAKLGLDKGGQTSKLAMFFDSGNKAFKQNFFTDDYEGELKLRLHVSSPTFERVRTHAINIYGSPLITDIQISEDGITPHKVLFAIREEIVKAETIQINATIQEPGGEKVYKVIDDIGMGLEIPAKLSGGKYLIDLKVTGKSVLGRDFSVSSETLTFEAKSLILEPLVEKRQETEQENQKEQEQSKEAATKIEEKIEEQPEQNKSEPNLELDGEESSFNWLYIGIGVNLLLAIIGFFVWRLMKKRSSKAASATANELAIEEDDDDDDE